MDTARRGELFLPDSISPIDGRIEPSVPCGKWGDAVEVHAVGAVVFVPSA